MLSVKQGSYEYQFLGYWFDPTRNQPKSAALEAYALTTRPSELLNFNKVCLKSVQNALKWPLQYMNFQKFSGGACPRTRWRRFFVP